MGNKSSARPNYVSQFGRSDKLYRVRITLRRIACIFGSPNHWGVAVETNSGWVSIQFSLSNGVGVSYHHSYTDAALSNWASDRCDVRSSDYGSAYSNLTLGDLLDHIEKLKQGRYSLYCLVFNDCQNFARSVVEYLTGKFVGWYPIEDGPDVS
jgi:hypothetical protein